MNDLSKPIFQATLGDLKEIIKSVMAEEQKESPPDVRKKQNYVYGVKGLATLVGCSLPTAQRIKKSGIIRSATYQFNKTVMFNADLVLELLKADRSSYKAVGKRPRFNF